ncbi:MAG: formate/nitrite transporter family protein [Alkaliphilus sp.]
MEQKMLLPGEVAVATIEAGRAKASKGTITLLLLGILAGAFISFGAVGATTLWGLTQDPGLGKLLGAAIFPVGIIFVVLAGSELFTGNSLMSLALMDKKIGFRGLLRNWALVYIGNFIGAVVIAILIHQAYLWGSVDGATNLIGAKAVAIAKAKMSIPFATVIIRGILCNMVVVLAVWIQTSAKDVTGKILAMWFPITLFAMSGYEHVIANMFFLPVGMFLGADITWSGMIINNFFPATIGNIIGGAAIIPALYYFILVKKSAEKQPKRLHKVALTHMIKF